MVQHAVRSTAGCGGLMKCVVGLALSIAAVRTVPPVSAQTRPSLGIRADSLASSVPASARFFVELNRLAPDGDSDRASSAKRLNDLLFGPPDARASVSSDWRRIIGGLGIKPGEAANALFSHRIAIAAPSWERLAEGIVLVRLRSGNADIEQAFPPTSMDVIDAVDGTIVYRTRTVLSVATNERTFILSQRRNRDSLYRQAIALMKDDTHPSLADQPNYQRVLQSSGGDIDGWLYLETAKEDRNPVSRFFGFDPTLVAVAMDLGRDGVEFSLRAAVASSDAPLRAAGVSLDRIKALPQTTVGAWSTRFDIRNACREWVVGELDDTTPGWIKNLAQILDVKGVADRIFGRLGSEAVVAWDQHLGEGRDIPQVAMLIPSTDSAGCARAVADVIQSVVDWHDLKKPEAGHRLRLNHTEYLGTPIYEVLWSDRSGVAAPPIIDRPTFAALDDAFVIATGPDQVRNIIDARLGLAPKLGHLSDVRRFGRRSDSSGMVIVFQPALAAQVVDAWLRDTDGAIRPWLDSMLGPAATARSRAATPAKLGIGVQPGDQPGSVTVARVYPSGRAHGRIQPNDRILGVNGTLLDLIDPAADLRTRVAAPPPNGAWTFRIHRGDHLLDVDVPAAGPRRVSQSFTDPTGALRQLQSLFQSVDFAGLRVTRTTDNTLTADLALRFSTPRPSSTKK